MKRLVALGAVSLILAVLAGVVWWAASQPTAEIAPTGPAAAVKLCVAADGLYRVPLADLEAAGLAGAAHRPQDVALTWRGQPIPRTVANDALIFYGQGSRSPYAAESAYWATLGGGVAPPERAVGPAAGAPATVYTATLRLEEEKVYYAKAPEDAGRWFWTSLTAPRAFTATFTLDERTDGSVRLRAALLGSTQAAVRPDHHVQLVLNGQLVADASWDGQTRHVVEAPMPAHAVRDGENTLVVQLPGDTGAPAEIVLLDWIEVAYPRRLEAQGDWLTFTGSAGSYQLGGFTGPVLAYDVTVPTAPVRLTGLAASFTDPLPGERQYIVVGPAGFRQPTRIAPAHPSALRDPATRADWVVIAPAELIPALQPLVAWRQQQGLAVLVADVQGVYDAFSFGEATPQALKDFLVFAHRQWQPAPRFVTLAGTASYDYRNVLGAPRQSQVPTYLLQSQFVGETGSDTWFADVADDDGRPELALGRLSAGAPAELRALCERIVAYERDAPAGDWRRRALFAADGKETTFRTLSEGLIARLPPTGTQVVRVYQGDFAKPEEARTRLLEEWNQGAWLLVYTGHAGINLWTDKQFFRMTDVAALRNGDRRPFAATMTCLDGYFHHPQVQCLAEALLLAPQGGVIAILAPTSESLPTDQEFLIRGLLSALYDPARPTIGEALVQAQRGLPDTPAARDLCATFNLLGDPATRPAGP